MPRSKHISRSTTATPFRQSRRAFLAGSAATLGLGFASHATRAAGTYPKLEGRTATLVVGTEVGGGYDLCGRLVARHMENWVPGLKFEVKNVAQASGMLGAKLLQQGSKDGNMLFTCSTSLLNAQILEEEGVAFDLRQWDWLGKLTSEAWLLVRGPGADFTTLDELRAKTKPSTLSVRSTSSASYHQALWINAMLGTRINPVPGYKSTEREAAVFNGEVMTTIETFPSSGALLKSPDIDVVLRLTGGTLPEKFQGRPLLADLVADRPSYAPLIRLFDANAKLGRWFAAPPGTDPAVVAEWRSLFEAIAVDPDFVSEMSKLDFKVDLQTGAEVKATIESVLADQAKTKALLQASYDCGKALADGLDNPCGSS